MSDDFGTAFQTIRDWASPIVAVGIAVAAWSKGAFSLTWNGGISRGALQTVQEQHGNDIAQLKGDVATLQTETRALATRDDIKSLEGKIDTLDGRIFEVLKEVLKTFAELMAKKFPDHPG